MSSKGKLNAGYMELHFSVTSAESRAAPGTTNAARKLVNWNTRGGMTMTAKLSPDSVGLIFTMHAAGHPVEHIADAADCSYSTVVRYLNSAGIVLGNKGKPKQLTPDYMALALDMRSAGSTWYDVEKNVGFHRSTFHSQLRAMRVQS